MSNLLKNTSSPYLLQHADNPVHWHAWGEEALTLAKTQNKPILLSIGYSACHWCHVMAHESFEDQEVAAIMNQHFINIKVDREERPDLDKIYQVAHYFITQRSGGWPLTMFLTPDQVPFFGGTYYPKANFISILPKIAAFYHSEADKERLQEQNQAILEMLKQISTTEISQQPLQADFLEQAYQELQKVFDEKEGGFGTAPKFPHPAELTFLFNYSFTNQDLTMVTTSLDAMAERGLYDHLQGGFYRYSVDAYWHIPHFEKMLYDNGSLTTLYSLAYLTTQKDLYKQVAIDTCDWVIAEMQDDNGGYYASLDADSQGEEGGYYIWDKQEVKDLLQDKYNLIESYWGLDKAPNFEDKAWHLQNAQHQTIDKNILVDIKKILLAKRQQRPYPHKDTKILTAWNGLMIQGMALTANITKDKKYQQSAEKAIEFIYNNLWVNNRLLGAYLDDYAFLLAGLLEYLQVTWNSQFWQFAEDLCSQMMALFYDDKQGGFYFTAKDHEQLIQRPKAFSDEAMPAGNGIAALAVLRMGYILGKPDYIQASKDTIRAIYNYMQRNPSHFSSLLNALAEHLQPTEIIIIRSDKNNDWLADYHYQPGRICFTIDNNETNLPAIFQDKKEKAHTIAYICKGTQCLEPIETIEQFKEILSK